MATIFQGEQLRINFFREKGRYIDTATHPPPIPSLYQKPPPPTSSSAHIANDHNDTSIKSQNTP